MIAKRAMFAVFLAASAAGFASPAASAAADEPLFRAKGYFYARYFYLGSASASTVYSGLSAMGSLRVSALAGKISLQYRSYHWMSFARTASSVLESPFENRHILQAVALETNGLGLDGLKLKLGRFFPELDYASTPVVDGGAATWRAGGFSLSAVLGRTVDLWTGGEDGPDLFAAAQIKVQSGPVTVSAGFNSGAYLGIKRSEIPFGANVAVSDRVWIEGYAAYDAERSELARAGLSLAWHSDDATLAVSATEWRNPFDQLMLLDKSKSLTTWGLYDGSVPATYRDARLSGSFAAGDWSFRGHAGLMAGVRSGWLAGASLTPPALLAGWSLTAGFQALKTDLVRFASIDAGLAGNLGVFFIELQSQLRTYTWISGGASAGYVDDFSELSVEYPIARHFFLNAAFGGYIRRVGNEGFKPQAELRLILRI